MFDVTLRPLLLILVALALILLNGVFVAAEFSIVRVRRTRSEELAGQGVEAAKEAILIVDYVSEYLAVTVPTDLQPQLNLEISIYIPNK